MDVGSADCVFDTRDRCIHSRASYLLLQIVEESPKIAFSIHFSDGNVAHDGSGAADVCRAARIGFGESGDGDELLVLHSRYESQQMQMFAWLTLDVVVSGIFGLLSRTAKEGRRAIKVIIDLAAIAAQITGFVVWPLLEENRPILWTIPIAAVMTSCAWWENYVCVHSPVGFVRAMGRAKEELRTTRYFSCIFFSLWKILVFFCSLVFILWFQGDYPMNLFNLFGDAFGPHKIVVEEVSVGLSVSLPDVIQTQVGDTVEMDADYNAVVYVLLLQIVAAYLCYIFGKFACKILIQGFSYAFPVNLTIPVSISLLIAACGIRNGDPCFFHGTIPDYLFFESPPVFRLNDFAAREMAWAWLLWLLSQTWITLHIWTPKCERLATTEKLFVSPMYSGLLIDQSMALNRRRDDQADVKTEVSSIQHSAVANAAEVVLSYLYFHEGIGRNREGKRRRILRNHFRAYRRLNTAQAEHQKLRPHHTNLRMRNHVARNERRDD